MRVLHVLEDRELAARPQMHFELAAAVDHVIVDALAVLAVGLAARVPVAFENLPRIGGEGRESGETATLRAGERNGGRTDTDEKPGTPGQELTHGAPFVNTESTENTIKVPR